MWRWLLVTAAAQPLELLFAVRHRSEQALREALQRVSDPRSADYGRYWALDVAGRSQKASERI